MYVLLVIGALVVGIAIGCVLTRRSARPAPPAAPAVTPPVDDRPSLPAQVLRALGEGVVVVNRDNEVLLANPAARALGALTGDRLAHDELRRLAYEALNGVDVGRGTVDLPRGYLGREVLSVSVVAVPLGPVERGRVQAVALLLGDQTETRRLEAVRRDFVANVSHELKTPVGALTLLAEAVQEAADDPEAVQRFAARMQHEGHRLGRLVGELIALSRVQGADALPERKPIAVEHLLTEAIDRSRLAADKAGIALVSAPAAGLIVYGDETQLSMAVSNLVDNAVSYSPGGTRVVVTARAVAATSERASCVEIVVADQGIGIADQDLDRIFERFYRVDPARSRATGGTGLGLAIVKHVVTNHGGTVDAWSSEGAGSTFTIRLPDTSPDALPDTVPDVVPGSARSATSPPSTATSTSPPSPSTKSPSAKSPSTKSPSTKSPSTKSTPSTTPSSIASASAGPAPSAASAPALSAAGRRQREQDLS